MESEKSRALVVEDRQDWQQILAKALRTADCEVDVAGGYEDAIKLLSEHSYQIAVIDPVLDNLNKYNRDGLRVLVQVNENFPQTRLIVVSGSITQTVLRSNPDLPRRLPLVEKQSWDRKRFHALVESLLNEGYDNFLMPKRITDEVAAILKTQEMPALPLESERIGVPRILIVEDRHDWQIILARALEKEGWYWRVANNAEEARDMLSDEGNAFQIVLLDLRLGDSDVPLQQGMGWRFLDYLADSEHRAKVIVISGEATRNEVANLFMNYEIVGLVDKDTFHSHDLIHQIRKLTAGPKIRVQTLGDFRITLDNEPVDDYGDDYVEMLLKYFITRHGEYIPIEELAEIVFPDHELYRAQAHIRDAINRARLILQPDITRPHDSAFIQELNNRFRLDCSRNILLDFEQLDRFLQEGEVQQAERAYARAIKIYERAFDIYQGEFLPNDRYETWSITMRGYLTTRFARILTNLADLYARDGRVDEAIRVIQTCLQHDTYSEASYRRLIRLQACKGDTTEALKVYNTMEKLFVEFFQEQPNAETQKLRDAIEAGEKIPCIEIVR